jgi:DNA-directed RNA polymerase specialized sigma24 family protein
MRPAVPPGQAQVVEVRYSGGLAEEEAASVLGIPPRTVGRGRKFARVWQARQLAGSPGRPA